MVTGRARTLRSYYVQRRCGGVPLRRKRVHLKSTRESFDNRNIQYELSDEEEEEANPSVPTGNTDTPARPVDVDVNNKTMSESTEPDLRRSGRIWKQTQFYQAV